MIVRLAATDPNGDAVTFSSPNLPGGATLNPRTGVLEWTPGYAQHGSYDITLWASDGTDAGTSLVGSNLYPYGFTALGNGKVAFINDDDGSLWVSDGTAAGTVSLVC